ERGTYTRSHRWTPARPIYAGDRDTPGQLLAKLDRSGRQAGVAARQAAERMAEHHAMIAQEGYRQSLAAASQAQSEIGSKQGMLEDARQQKARAQGMLKQAQSERVQARNEVAEAREAVAAAQAERSEADADLA